MANVNVVAESMRSVRQVIRTHAAVVAPPVYSEDELDCIAIDATLAAQRTIYDHFGKEGEQLGALLRVIAAKKRRIEVYHSDLSGGRRVIHIAFQEGNSTRALEPAEAFELLQALAWGLLQVEELYGDQTLQMGE